MRSKIHPTGTPTQIILFYTVGNTKGLVIEERQGERYDMSGTVLCRGNASAFREAIHKEMSQSFKVKPTWQVLAIKTGLF